MQSLLFGRSHMLIFISSSSRSRVSSCFSRADNPISASSTNFSACDWSRKREGYVKKHGEVLSFLELDDTPQCTVRHQTYVPIRPLKAFVALVDEMGEGEWARGPFTANQFVSL
ncbi:hypothetical protein VNO80_10824 [Phaseolus coccineus]|uniref:Uncharacterized protein n=1 Tax=Phaseolus coccineus TaxID=3886 RepID=A0AAN9REY9_PHACN